MQKGDKLLPDPHALCCLFTLVFPLLTFFFPVLRRENSQTEVSPALPSSPSIAPHYVFVVSSRLEWAFYPSLQLFRCTDKTDRTENRKHTHSYALWIVKPLSLPCWLTLPAIILFASSAAQNDRNVSKVRPVISFAGVRTLYQKSLPHIYIYIFFGGSGSLFFFWLTLHF